MIEDITPPSAGQFINYRRTTIKVADSVDGLETAAEIPVRQVEFQPEHTDSPECPACRGVDREARNNRRGAAKIAAEARRLDYLAAHCKHPQTRTILMRRGVEDENGLALEEVAEAQMRIGCGHIAWETAS